MYPVLLSYPARVHIHLYSADTFSLGLTFYNEITVMNIRPGQCIPVNELVMSGMYEESVRIDTSMLCTS